VTDRNQFDIDLVRLKNSGGPANGQFTDSGFRGTRPR
jgi:hypothetical protein